MLHRSRFTVLLPAIGVVALAGANGGDPERRASARSLELELRMEVSGDDMAFGEIVALVADEAGRMYAADGQAQEIVVVDADGTAAGTIGRRGEGPGEFRSLSDLAWAGDLLAVFDWRSGITLLRRNGRVAATSRWPGRAGSRLYSGDDEVYGKAVIHQSAEPSTPRPAPDVRYATVSRAGVLSELPAVRDSVAWPSTLSCATPDGWIHPLPVPFAEWGPLRAFLPEGTLARAHREAYTIDLIDPTSGEVLRSIRRDVARVPLTDERWERQPTIRELRRLDEERGEPTHARRPEEPCPLEGGRPELLPAIRAVVADELGRLWVESPTEDGFSLGVFDADGELLGESPMPDRDPDVAPYVRGDRLYVVTIDALDVQSIEVYDIHLRP